MKKFKTIVQYVTKYLNQNQKKRNLDGNGISTQAVTYVMIALRRKTSVMKKNGIFVLSATKKWDLYVIIQSPNGR
jgi:hypothetical protein